MQGVAGSIPAAITMDNFEAGTLPQKQKEINRVLLCPAKDEVTHVKAQCWECGEHKLCNEYLACCTGTRFHSCPKCEKRIREEQ